jgi:hypothetical protein
VAPAGDFIPGLLSSTCYAVARHSQDRVDGSCLVGD